MPTFIDSYIQAAINAANELGGLTANTDSTQRGPLRGVSTQRGQALRGVTSTQRGQVFTQRGHTQRGQVFDL